MSARKLRSERGEMWHSQAGFIIGLAAIAYYGYQYFTIYKAPNSLVNKDFVCGNGAFKSRQSARSYSVLASQDPKVMVAWVRASNFQARLAPPDKALANENERDRLMFGHQLINLAASAGDEPYTEMYNPLVVHVLETDDSAKDVPLLVVRPVNKAHKGQTWYIAATSINPAANVTGFAETAAKTHKLGVADVIENKNVQHFLKSVNDKYNK